MSRKVAPNVYESRGFHFYVKQVDGQRQWVRLGKIGKRWNDITPDSYAMLAKVLRGETRGGMAALFARYREQVLPTKAVKTQSEQSRQLTRLDEVFGALEIDDLKSTMVARYLDATMARRPVAGNREIALLSDVFARAIRWGLAERNPCTGVKRNKEAPRTRAITDREFRAVLDMAREPVRHAMELALLTGQRIGDLLRARWSSITPDGLAFRQGKTGKQLLVQFSPELLALLDRCKARARAMQVTTIDPHLIVGRGGRYTSGGFSTEWQALMRKCVAAGIERFTFHDIRSLSADRHKTGEHLGHANPATTRRIYNRRPRIVDPAEGV